MPARADLSLTLSPGDPASAQAAPIAAAAARLPQPFGVGGAPEIGLARRDDGKTWQVRVTPQPGPGADLFVDPPDGWYFDTLRQGDGFRLLLAQRPSDAPAGPVQVALTLVDGTRAYEGRVALDVAGGAP